MQDGNRMNREKMVKMLMALDKELDHPLEIVITGASALIIQGHISRVSSDIDVLVASENIDRGEVKKIIEKMAVRFSLQSEWRTLQTCNPPMKKR